MQVKCIRAFSFTEPGDLVEVPDGAVVDPYYFEPVAGDPDPGSQPASPSPFPPTDKEM